MIAPKTALYCVCGAIAGLPSQKSGEPTTNFHSVNIRIDEDYITSIKHRDIFNMTSPHFAVADAMVVNRDEVRAYFAFLFESAAKMQPDGLGISGVPINSIFERLDFYFSQSAPARMSCLALLRQDLQIQLEDELFDHLVRRPGARYHLLSRHFDTADKGRDYRGICDVVAAIARIVPGFAAGMKA
ncbi:hypothetical protein ACN47E_008218 [Coniothyrium glycines]